MKKLHIKRFDKKLPLPAYKTKGAVCLDCHARTEITIPPRQTALVPLNVALKPPKRHFVLLAARSSFFKRGLLMPNGVGIGDEDFCGDTDEYHLPVFNFTDSPVTIARGDRLAQILILPYPRLALKEVKKLKSKSRGGFGTTGK
jgi:dUTP pyrophosphatase